MNRDPDMLTSSDCVWQGCVYIVMILSAFSESSKHGGVDLQTNFVDNVS